MDHKLIGNVNILNIGRSRPYPHWVFREVASPFSRLYFICSGQGWLSYSGQEYELRPGRLYMIPSFMTHSYEGCTPDFDHYYVHIYQQIHHGGLLIEDFNMPFAIEEIGLDRLLFERLLEINPGMSLTQINPRHYDTPGGLSCGLSRFMDNTLSRRLESRGILIQILSRFMKAATLRQQAEDVRIKRAMSIMLENIDARISVGALARDACVSTDHFIRMFKRETGVSPMEFINRRKVEQAQILLATTTLQVKEVAFRVGFADNAYFSRVFRRHAGMSPARYRKAVSTS